MNLNKHFEFFNPLKIKENRINVNIIGVGAVGSFIALQLAKLGVPEIIIWDFDTVDDHNITNQVYNFNDLNKKKVDALEEHLLAQNPAIKITKKGKWNPGDAVSGVVFLEVDSMKIRQAFVDDNQYNDLLLAVIDARIGLATGEVHFTYWKNEEMVEHYSEKVHAFDDSQASVAVSACGTVLSVSPSVLIAASEAVGCFINLINGEENRTYTTFDAFKGKMNSLNI